MSKLQDVLDQMDALKATLVTIDQKVEDLYKIISAANTSDISDAAKTALTDKLAELEAAAAVIPTQDQLSAKGK